MAESVYGIFIDGDNVGAKNYCHIYDIIKPRGKIIIKRVYTDFSEENTRPWKKICCQYGVEAIHVWREKGKNSSDIKMVCDVLDMIHRYPFITHYVIVTGDKDVKELLIKLISYNKMVICISDNKSSASHHLENFCSEYIILSKKDRSQR